MPIVNDVGWHSFTSVGGHDEVVAAVSTRRGGVSAGPFESLNLSFSVGDDSSNVRENRRRFAAAIGVDESRVVCAQQVHGDRIGYVDDSDAGSGYAAADTAVPGIDGMVTDRRGVALWLGFADCVPVLLHDPVRHAVGIAHAGWRGTLATISRRLVEAMVERFGSDPANLRAAIGPSIGPCCYTVGPDVVESFERSWSSIEGLFVVDRSGDRSPRLNLWEANRRTLAGAGVPERQVTISGHCTSCAVEEFFSHRAQRGRAGRIAAVIALASGQEEHGE